MTGTLVAAVVSDGGGWAPWVAVALCAAGLAPAGLRWLRVAQREHYIPDAVSRFAVRWWSSEPANWALAVLSVAGVGLSARWPLAAVACAVAALVGPVHLGLRGRTSRLVFTRRLKTLAAVWLVLEAVVIVCGVVLGDPAPFAAAGLVLAPGVVDAALLLTAPVERRLSEHFVRSAAERLRRVAPTVVAITGSYGKTSTKNHVAHLLSGTKATVATPASFNNRGGLARSVNEHLVEGTDVFVAEMGTYGPGEIRELCSWCTPQIAVLTAVGPVHLERFGTEDAIAAAKSEITERASTVVVNADDPRLAELANRLTDKPDGPEVVRCSALDSGADVCVRREGSTVSVSAGGAVLAAGVSLADGVQPTNLAVAVAVALRLGVPAEALAGRIATMATVPNRLTAATSAAGVRIIDDTFNSNPAGARAALAALSGAGGAGRRVLVTPGMVELGRRQAEENEAFARAAAEVATDVVVVGLTNRRALLAGLRRQAGGAGEGGVPQVLVVRTRDEAVAWVRATLGPGDAVLYENDLPDQYP